MCGRGTLTIPFEDLEYRFGAAMPDGGRSESFISLPSYNMAPSQFLPVITGDEPGLIQFYRWGLVPFWAEKEKTNYSMINARIETVTEKPSFRHLLSRRRCLWPVDGYYEWIRSGAERIPYRVTLHDQSIFSVAGLWDCWRSETGEELYTFTILTCPAHPSMEYLHPRMPVILPRSLEKTWIDPEWDPGDFLQHPPEIGEDSLRVYRVSTKVNSVKDNSKDLIREVPDIQQGMLF